MNSMTHLSSRTISVYIRYIWQTSSMRKLLTEKLYCILRTMNKWYLQMYSRLYVIPWRHIRNSLCHTVLLSLTWITSELLILKRFFLIITRLYRLRRDVCQTSRNSTLNSRWKNSIYTSEKENSHECCRNIKPYKLWFCSDIRNHSIILFCRNMLGR